KGTIPAGRSSGVSMRWAWWAGFVVFAVAEANEGHWAYEPPVAAVAPAGKHPVDAVLEAAWNKAGVTPAAETTPRRRLERAAYTLTGLPPEPGQIERIEADPGE